MWSSSAVLLAAGVIGVGAWDSRPGLTSPLGPVVDLGYAAYAGNSTSPAGQPNSTVTFYGGIPYVQPPLGNLRFRTPKDLDETYNPNRTVVDARSWGPTCVQQPAKEGVGVEDCLNLNIWKPSSAKAGAKLPVIAYIHGGGFFFGTNATLEKVLKLYPAANVSGSPFVDNYDRAWTIMQDTVFGCMDQHWANATRALGRKNVYAFRFNVPNPVTLAVNPWQGVMHASDVYYLFNGATGTTPFFAPFNITQVPVAQEIMQYWTSFSRSSDPSKFKRSYSPLWPNYTGNRRIVMSEDVSGGGNQTASLVETIPTYEQERCSFWMSLNETRV
ncbi:hypothetical protein RSAG8_04001, partial [Rhizoctonia solani AG-8 WAC10335]